MGPRIFFIGMGLVLLWIAVTALRNDEVRWKAREFPVTRRSKPISFWASVAISALIGLVALAEGCFKLF